MKNCTHCGKEFPDDFWFCPTDGAPLKVPEGAPPATPQAEPLYPLWTASASEQRLWERMTFRQFGVLVIRLQAVWLLLDAGFNVLVLARTWYRINGFSGYSPLSSSINFEVLFYALRIIATVAAAIFVIQKSERILSWLVRDLIPKEPSGTAEEPVS